MAPRDVSKYIEETLKYIFGDLTEIMSREVPASYPLVLLVFAGIEFLSRLLYDDPTNESRSSRFFLNWMSEQDARYGYGGMDIQRSFGAYLYKFARSALAHSASVQDLVAVEHKDDERNNHLKYVRHKSGRRILLIHSYQFSDDFISAADAVLERIAEDTKFCHDVGKRIGALEKEWTRSSKRFADKASVSVSESGSVSESAVDWGFGEGELKKPDSGTYTPGTGFS